MKAEALMKLLRHEKLHIKKKKQQQQQQLNLLKSKTVD